MDRLLIILLLGIHAFLITLYADMMNRGRSRLDRRLLLLAVFLPFVGEVCLIIAEFGFIPDRPRYETPFRECAELAEETSWKLPDNWKTVLDSNEQEARSFVLQIVNHAPEKNIEVLKYALHSKSSEVSHIAAAQMMKLHQSHEDRIGEAEKQYKSMPGNMEMMGIWIDAISTYRVSGLLDHASLTQIQHQEKDLLTYYLSIMPHRREYRAERLRLALDMGELNEAVKHADLLTALPDAGTADWNLAYDAYKRLGDEMRTREFLLRQNSLVKGKK